ncbi:MAG TPA: type II toxin-antitoxin system VapC family toxin [Steroidobacteraceae bacterium]|jgi:predicted nucleic acid-binding protein|nr:type II toxin-antitoxin system VapC family toxin [Steroidobacteraceae bacterium]
MVLIDTNVLLDVLQNDAEWAPWSQDQLDAASATDTLAINPIIYSELSMAFARIEELDAVIEEVSLKLEAIPRDALFLAGKVFLTYRRSQGTKYSVLPDFFIGAHAAVTQWPILTRDVGRYRRHFPTVQLIAP